MNYLTTALLFLAAAVLLVPLCRKLNLGAVLGYLLAGILIGPSGLKLVGHVDEVMHISELGVILLLFIIGLELQPSRLWVLRRSVFGTIAAVIIGGRLLLRPAFRIVARAGNRELFTAAALLTVLGAALVLEWAGLSMSLGAFLAGVLLADSEYRHELEANIEPFKGLLLGLFFMAVGMSANLSLLVIHPWALLGITLGLMAIKGAVLFVIVRVSGSRQAWCVAGAGWRIRVRALWRGRTISDHSCRRQRHIGDGGHTIDDARAILLHRLRKIAGSAF